MDHLWFPGRDGTRLAYRETGRGRPLILLHGVLGTGGHWLAAGPGYALADSGFRLILPDFRAHGQSEAPRDPAAYPADVLADDGLALIGHLGLGPGEYDLGGYSLGARIVLRLLARGARPGRAIVAAQGLAKVSGPQDTPTTRPALTALASGTELAPGSADAQMASWITQLGLDPRALLCLMDSLVPTPEEELRRLTTPVLVVIGDKDERTDADQLAALLPAGRFATVPGNHGSAFRVPQFASLLTDFLRQHG